MPQLPRAGTCESKSYGNSAAVSERPILLPNFRRVWIRRCLPEEAAGPPCILYIPLCSVIFTLWMSSL